MKTVFNITLFLLILPIVLCGSKPNNSLQKSKYGDDELVKVEMERKVTCPDCGGSGNCIYICTSCGGTGKTTHYIAGSRPKSCSSCNGTGREYCRRCNGSGYTKCQYCSGRGHKSCMSCKGEGLLVVGNNVIQCFACKGCGYEDCTLCDNGRMPCDCNNGRTFCRDCFGSGYSGRENYSKVVNVECTNCNGSGKFRSKCNHCNGNGWIIEKYTVIKRKSELK